MTGASPSRHRQRRPAALQLLEACLLAAVVGIVAYVAGFRKGVRTAQLGHRQSGVQLAHDQRGATAPGAPSNGMDMAALTEKLEQISSPAELVAIADQHLDEGRSAVRAGDVAGAERRFQIAVAAYERALALSPGDPDCLTALGIALRGVHDPAGAAARFREAAEGDPSHVDSRFNLGLVLLKDLGMEAEGVAVWEEYLEVAPKTDREREFVESELRELEASG